MAGPSYTLQQLQDRYDILFDAIVAGVLSVKDGSRTTTYQSTQQMEEALALLGAKIDAANGQAPNLRAQRSYINFNKGFSGGCGNFNINTRDGN